MATCKECLHAPVCEEVNSLKCRKDFAWYRAESGCPHFKPAADVVSKNESREINSTWAAIYAAAHEKWEKAYEQIEYTLRGVMYSVDKWLEGDELIDDEVNRAITMREKTLQIIENAKSEVAREIFEEIEALATKHLAILEILNPQMSAVAAGGKHAFDLVLALTTELKKKYTEENDGT